MYLRSKKGDVSEGLIAGAIAGLVASWIMPRFQSLMAHALGHPDPHEGQGEDATVKTAQRISSALFGHELSGEEKKTAGLSLHYAYGIGAVYGGLAQKHGICFLPYRADSAEHGSSAGVGGEIWSS
jgi:putative membrane protein